MQNLDMPQHISSSVIILESPKPMFISAFNTCGFYFIVCQYKIQTEHFFSYFVLFYCLAVVLPSLISSMRIYAFYIFSELFVQTLDLFLLKSVPINTLTRTVLINKLFFSFLTKHFNGIDFLSKLLISHILISDYYPPEL